jgi:hypothetical protein
MRISLSILGAIASFTLIIGSAAMNWQFGYSLGKTSTNGLIYGGISVAADILKCLVPFFIAWAFYNRNLVQSLAGIGVLVLCVSYSLTSSVGYSVSNRGAVSKTETVESSILNSNKLSLIADTERLQAIRATLTNYAAILKKRGYLKQSERAHRAEILKEQENLKSDIAQYKKDLKLGIITVAQANTVTSQQGFIASVSGVSEKYVAIGLVGLLALLLEVGSTLGLWVSIHHLRGKEGKPASPQEPAKLPEITEGEPKGIPKSAPRLGVTLGGDTSNIVLLPRSRNERKCKGQKYANNKAVVGAFLDTLPSDKIRPHEAYEEFQRINPGALAKNQFFSALKAVHENYGFSRKVIKGKNYYYRAA